MNKKILNIALSVIILSIVFTGTVTTISAKETARPIEDFISKQGKYCIENGTGGCLNFNPPNFISWTDPKQGRLMTVDYAGLESKFFQDNGISLDTTTEGTITEYTLTDGRAEVIVNLRTRRASTWVTQFDPTIPFDPNALSTYQAAYQPLLFGHRPSDVLDGKDIALGDSFLKVSFINTAPGAPMPDLVQLVFFPEPTQQLLSVSFNVYADGTLREAAFGIPDGTTGKAEAIQTGLIFVAGTNSSGRIALAGFPAERIDLNKVEK